jgi:membrane protease YdiL (CAAX protease family)
MTTREKALVAVALSGPILLVIGSSIAVSSSDLDSALPIMAAFSFLGLGLAFAGFVGCVYKIVNRKNKARPKLIWVLLMLFDFLLVGPFLFFLFGG